MKKKQPAHHIEYPEIFLAIDNCFASKRYTEPVDWISIINDLNINYIEASADNECDPLYMGMDYLERWAEKVKIASKKSGISICNLYSGHGTYSTLGLAHTDPSVRERILNNWIKPMIETAADLDAGLGFYCHAFADKVLQDPGLYKKYQNTLIDDLAEAAVFSNLKGCRATGVEQMYSPHQIPWTIKGTKNLLSRIYEKSSVPLYTTLDTGHQSGQRNFLKPEKEYLLKSMEQFRKRGKREIPWLGPIDAYRIFERSDRMEQDQYPELTEKIFELLIDYPHMFAEPVDCSPYKWLEKLGCYSPIIHLQQTDGTFSHHLPFTKINNEKGIIDGKRVLESIKDSYDNEYNQGIPKVDKIYMTIEVFLSTASVNYQSILDLEETVKYWRYYIPEDGMNLKEIVTRLN